jgi:hypothetical protein
VRPLAAAVLAGVLACAVSGCSTSPSAATVNGQVITQHQVFDDLRSWSSSKAYVGLQDGIYAENAMEQGDQSAPPAVKGTGTGPDIYGTIWTSQELTNMITAVVVHQYLAHRHEAPSALQLMAAWDSQYAFDPAIWEQISRADRTSEAEQDAERALLEPKLANASGDKTYYSERKSYFWSKVCLATAGPLSMKAAEAAAAGGELPARHCDSPEQFVEQPASLAGKVNALAPGRAVVVREGGGYEAVKVLSRTVLPYSPAIAGVVEVVAIYGGSQEPPYTQTNAENGVINVLRAAHVDVDSTFGSWLSNSPSYPPQVLPPGDHA